MNQTMRSRKGVTLAEIMVTVALVAIVITMVVSFTLVITQRTKNNAINDAMRRDVDMIRVGAERWLNTVAKEGDELICSDATAVTAQKEGAAVGTLTFRNGVLKGDMPGGNSLTLRTEYVTSVTFEALKNVASGDYLLYCTVTFDDSDADEPITFTLCLNSHVGEGVQGGGST